MLTQSLSTPVLGTTVSHAPLPATDAFATITGHAGLIATEFSYKKDEEIYGEDEPAEYVYQVISGSVRTYKLLSDGLASFQKSFESLTAGLEKKREALHV